MNDLTTALRRRATVSTNLFQMSRVALFFITLQDYDSLVKLELMNLIALLKLLPYFCNVPYLN